MRIKTIFGYLLGILFLTIIVNCGGVDPTATPAPPKPPSVEIVVSTDDADVLAGEEVMLSLKAGGVELSYTWSAHRGSLSTTDEATTMYTAPFEDGVDIVTVVVADSSGATTIESISLNVIVPPTEAPVQIEPTPEIGLPIIADFNNCGGGTNLGGGMGAANDDPDRLSNTYEKEDTGDGCYIRIEYDLQEWAGFWMKLQGANLGDPYKFLAFDIKGDVDTGIPDVIKVEIKADCNSIYDDCQQTSILYVDGISGEWQTVFIELDPNVWDRLSFADPVSSFEEIGQLVFTVEAKQSGSKGAFYLDNVRVTVDK